MAPLSALVMLACVALSSSGAAGLRISLTRIDHYSNPGGTASELTRRDTSRHGRELASSDATIAAPIRYDGGHGLQYLMTLSIGTPPVAFPALLDTGSNFIMTQCAPCTSACGFERAALYDPSASTTFAELPCNSSLRPGLCDDADSGGADAPPGCPCTRNQTYGTGWAFFTMGVETFTFGSTADDQGVPVAGMAFGCVSGSDGGWGSADGMVGLGRGNQSLVAQLGARRFSYCLTPFHDGNSTSTLLVGPSAALNDDTGARSTPFVPSPPGATRSTHYYLNLTGISVGNKSLSIPADAFSLSADGGGGIIIDSGWTTTALVDVAYQEVRAEVLSLLQDTLSFADASNITTKPKPDLCFELPAEAPTPPAMPDMTFHFDGADMVLPTENYMFLDSLGAWCLRMRNTTAADGSVLGNYQQQNIHFLFDLDREMLSFAPADCSTV